jgi:hypothetical protein
MLAVVAVATAAYVWWSRVPRIDGDTIALPIAFRTPGGLLEVAGINTTETFTKTSLLTIAGINLGTTVSQIQVPVTYRYQIGLAKNWKIHLRNGKLLVIAPAVMPSVPVAIDTSRMQMRTQSGWARFDGRENLDSLLREITPELEKTARAPHYIEAQREQARKTVTEFATKWLVTQERWKGVMTNQIQVYFVDEPIGKLRTFGPEFGGAL